MTAVILAGMRAYPAKHSGQDIVFLVNPVGLIILSFFNQPNVFGHIRPGRARILARHIPGDHLQVGRVRGLSGID
jgi:hypothetical protein